MIDLLTQLVPEWIAKFRTPMSDPTHRYWDRMRRRGIVFYLMLWSLGMGGVLFAFDMGWDRLVDHIQIDRLFAGLFAVGCVLFALILGTVNWYVNESRYEKSPTLQQNAPSVVSTSRKVL